MKQVWIQNGSNINFISDSKQQLLDNNDWIINKDYETNVG